MLDESNPWIYREVLERLLTGIYVVDRCRRIVFWSDGAERISGYLRQDVVGRFCRDQVLDHCDLKSRTVCHCECPLAEAMQDGHPRESRMYLKHRNGQRVPVLVRAVAIRDANGVIVGAAESFDVQMLALTVGNLPSSLSDQIDELTGLPNHWFALSHLQQRMVAVGKEFRPFTILRISVAHYAELLRRYGATAGALLLRNVGQSLRNGLKPSDILARWNESEFVVVVEIHDQALVAKIRQRLDNIVGCTSLSWWGDEIAVKARFESRTVERSQEKQTILSWLGPVEPSGPVSREPAAAPPSQSCGERKEPCSRS